MKGKKVNLPHEPNNLFDIKNLFIQPPLFFYCLFFLKKSIFPLIFPFYPPILLPFSKKKANQSTKMEPRSNSNGSCSPTSSFSDTMNSPISESEGEDSFLSPSYQLPIELWESIFSFLHLQDLFRVARTCKLFYSIIHQKRSKFWRGKFWFIESASSPSHRLCHAGAITETANGPVLVLMCGDKPRPHSSTRNVGEILNDVWSFNLMTKEWKKLMNTGMPPLTEHGCLSFGNDLYIFGGITLENKRTNTLFRYNLEREECSLVPAKGKLPSPGSCHSCSFYDNKLFVFGGWDPTNISSSLAEKNQFFCFDLATSTWSEVEQKGDPPSRRRAHRSVMHNDSMYLFGGWTRKPENDLYCFNMTTQTWSQIDPKGEVPSPRSRFGMAIHQNYIYIFGGWDGVAFLDDFFSFHILTSTWTKVGINFPRKIGQQLVCTWNDIMFVFGGNDGNQAYSDFYGLYLTDR